MPAATQESFPFWSLDFEGRDTLTVDEIAAKLRCTRQHILDLIDERALGAIDIAGRDNKTSRRAARVPIECWRDFVLASMTTEYQRSPLKDLPTAALIKLQADIRAHLKAKGIPLKP